MSAIVWDPQDTVATVTRPQLRLVQGGRADSARMHLSRRALAGWAAVLAAVILWGGQQAGAGTQESRVVSVHPGQTLSHIAAAELPDLPVRDAVLLIQQANGLDGSGVSAGTELIIPAH